MRGTIRPVSSHPLDFEAFWARTVRELNAIGSDLDKVTVDHPGRDTLHLARISFRSLGRARIRGYLLEWTDSRPRPLVIHSHGYEAACSVMWPWALEGLNVLGVDIRGFGSSRDALPVRSKWGYMLTGSEAPETYVLRGAVCDYIQAVRIGHELLSSRISRTVLHGVSFAGGLALMAEGTRPAADLLALGVPTFGWAEGRQFFVKAGSGAEINRFLAARPEAAEDLMVVLRYFDPMNFAGRIRCPTVIGLGRRDEVVPAPTVYAIADHLAGPHEVLEFPVSHSDSPEEQLWEQFETCWLRLACNGVPDDFGEPPSDPPV